MGRAKWPRERRDMAVLGHLPAPVPRGRTGTSPRASRPAPPATAGFTATRPAPACPVLPCCDCSTSRGCANAACVTIICRLGHVGQLPERARPKSGQRVSVTEAWYTRDIDIVAGGGGDRRWRHRDGDGTLHVAHCALGDGDPPEQRVPREQDHGRARAAARGWAAAARGVWGG